MNCKLAGLADFILISSSIFTVVAQGTGKQPSPGAAFTTSILPMMLVMFVIIYFLMIRPEQKKQKDRQNLLAGIKKGDKVLTIGGIYGIVGNVKESTVMLKIGDNMVIEVTKAAVSSVISRSGDGAEKPEKEGEKGK